MIKQTLDPHAKRVCLKRGAVPSINLPKRRFDKVLTPKQMEMIANKAIRVERREPLKTLRFTIIGSLKLRCALWMYTVRAAIFDIYR